MSQVLLSLLSIAALAAAGSPPSEVSLLQWYGARTQLIRANRAGIEIRLDAHDQLRKNTDGWPVLAERAQLLPKEWPKEVGESLVDGCLSVLVVRWGDSQQKVLVGGRVSAKDRDQYAPFLALMEDMLRLSESSSLCEQED